MTHTDTQQSSPQAGSTAAPDPVICPGEGHRFVFVLGLHRSGTSVLHRCIRDHHMVSGFHGTGVSEDEGQLLQSVFTAGRAHGGPGTFGLDPTSHLDETSPLATKANAARLFEEWSAYWDLSRPVLVEKSPPSLVRARFFQTLFPNSWFIVVRRHPLAVAFATQKWSRTSIPQLVRHWLTCYERFEADRPHLRRVLEMKYEDYVASPQTWMERVYDFLELPRMEVAQEVRGDANKRYVERWRAMRGGPRGRFVAAWTMHRYERRVQRFGYSLREWS